MFAAAGIVLALMGVVMAAAWMTQRVTKNAGWVDVFWTFGTGAACVLVALWPAPAAGALRQTIVAALGAVWALRLGSYVGVRVARGPEDTRYARLREDWGATFQSRLLALVLVQAPATALMTLSVFAAAHGGTPFLGWRDLAGVAVLALAIGGEALADEQMRRFKRAAPRGAVMDKGLWAWSRHPNYFFEWLGWTAYPIIGFDAAAPLTALTFVAPALMYVILRYGTGVPMLERLMLESRGEAFRAYQARVSPFLLRPPRKQPARG